MSKFSLNRQDPTGVFRPLSKFTETDLRQMYSIYQKYYENTRYELFVQDFQKKTGAFLILHPKTQQIVGFSTVLNCEIKVGQKSHRAVFSGDTIIEKQYWGSRALQFAMFHYLLKLKLKNPFEPIYWMLISKGFKTYLLLANNYASYYPHPEGGCDHLQPIVEAYCEQYFNGYFDRHEGVLDFGDDYQPLKNEVAPITPEMLENNSKIRFFEERNPNWRRGTELPCVGELQWRDFFRYSKHFAIKSTSRGRLDAALPARAQAV